MIKFSLELPIRSGNIILRSHWVTRRKMLTQYEWAIRAIFGPVPSEPPSRRMRVKITSYRGRLLDKDNLYAGTKILVDALRRTRLIRDDSPHWLELEVKQVLDGENPRTEIEITESRFRPKKIKKGEN